MSIVPINRYPQQQMPPHLHVVRDARAESGDGDPEDALRHHLRDTLATRMLRFEEDLVLATEADFITNPGAAIKALQDLERTRASLAHDIRETSKVLNGIILDRYRARYPDPPP